MKKSELLKSYDVTAVRQLWDVCFDDSSEFTDWFFEKKFRQENTLVIREDKRVAAALQVLPMNLSLRGKAFQTGFVVGVSTSPEQRGKGYATALLEDAFALMKERGVPYTSLYPVSYDFYRRVGYEIGSDIQRYTVFADQLDALYASPEYECQSAYGYAEGMKALYQEFIQRYSGAVLRDGAAWERKLEEVALEDETLVVTRKGDVAAYAFYNISRGQLNAYEMIYEEQAALQALICGLRRLYGGKMELILPADCRLYALLKDGRNCCQLEPYGMLRVVDVLPAVNGLRAEYQAVAPVNLELEDEFAPWNSGRYTIFVKDGRVIMEPGEEASLSMDIGSFSQLVAGMCSAEELLSVGRIRGEDLLGAKLLSQILPPVHTFELEKW